MTSNIEKRIALFLPTLGGGGAERVMVSLANEFAGRGFLVDLVLVKAEGPYLKDVAPTVRIVDLNSSRLIFGFPKLVKYFRKEKPPVILSALNHVNIVTLWAKRIAFSKVRVIISEHNTLSIAQGKNSNWKNKLIRACMRMTYSNAGAIVAVSKGVADDLAAELKIARTSIEVIYNPVVTEKLHQLSFAPVVHPWTAPGQPAIILGIGRLTEAKDFSTLIRSFEKVRKDHSTRLVILGEGNLRSELERLVLDLDLADDVLLPGFVENPYAWMRCASVFVLSSVWEGLPTVLIEAMACGTPVVSTNCPSGPSEILENGKWGRLVPVRDYEALALEISATLVNDAKPNVSSRAMDFTVEKSVQNYLKLIEYVQTHR